jgi:hypothetical protein
VRRVAVLQDETERICTQANLADLQARYERLQKDPHRSPHVRDLTLASLKRLINQLTEEIAVYRTHHMAAR